MLIAVRSHLTEEEQAQEEQTSALLVLVLVLPCVVGVLTTVMFMFGLVLRQQ